MDRFAGVLEALETLIVTDGRREGRSDEASPRDATHLKILRRVFVQKWHSRYLALDIRVQKQ